MKGPEPIIDWSVVDWSESNTSIAQRIGCHSATVVYWRKIYMDRHIAELDDQIDWRHVDWSMTDGALADDLGVHISTIREVRAREGK